MKTVNAVNQILANRSANSGLRNIERRLEFAYGHDAAFTFGVKDGLYCTELRVPLKRIYEQEERKLLLSPNFN